MSLLRFARRHSGPQLASTNVAGELTDDQLIALFRTDSGTAWRIFLDRYTDRMLGCLRGMGFDHDEAMDRYVYVCEKLAENDCRRLREVQRTGDRGELTPWLRTVVKNLSTNWAWSVHGRRRLFRSIEALPALAREVFELSFWQGLPPSGVYEVLRGRHGEGHGDPLGIEDVFDALEQIHDNLDVNNRWRLMSQLSRQRRALAIGVEDPETGLQFEPADSSESPQETAIRRERSADLEEALEQLTDRDRLIVQLRFEESLAVKEVAEIVDVSPSTVKNVVRSSLEQLREILTPATTAEGEAECQPVA